MSDITGEMASPGDALPDAHTMNVYFSWTLTVLYWIVYPVYIILYYIAYAVVRLLAPVTAVLIFLLQPFVYFAQFVARCIAAPFYFLARFETLYIYLGVAVLTGVAIALLLHVIYSFLYSNLRLAPQPSTTGPTAKQYRESRRRKAKLSRDPMLAAMSLSSSAELSGGVGRERRGGRQSLLAQTIHEEDSDF